MRRGVSVGPDLILIGVLRPVARTFTCVPPTSMTRIFMQLPPATHGLGGQARASVPQRIPAHDPRAGAGKLFKQLTRLELSPCRDAALSRGSSIGPPLAPQRSNAAPSTAPSQEVQR